MLREQTAVRDNKFLKTEWKVGEKEEIWVNVVLRVRH
jgi:hypothetical protein